MKIGLVRHFKVISPHSDKKLSSKEFNDRMDGYDIYPVKPNHLEINNAEWDVCFASTLSRARTTAETIFEGKIIHTPLIVEVPLSSFIKTDKKLHYMVWQIIGRFAWFFSHKSQKENISQTFARINQFLDLINNSEHQNILIVSHGFFMKALVHKLKKNGFEGHLDFSPQNGKLYTFHRK